MLRSRVDAREEGVPARLGVDECSRALRPGFVEKEAVSRSVGTYRVSRLSYVRSSTNGSC